MSLVSNLFSGYDSVKVASVILHRMCNVIVVTRKISQNVLKYSENKYKSNLCCKILLKSKRKGPP